MNLEVVEKALAVVRREMGCSDARLELGGAPPSSPVVVHAPSPGGYRLVAVFEEAPADVAQARKRLRQLAAAFFESGLSAPTIRPDAEQHLAQRRLDDELSSLAGRTAALGASVVDVQSPMLWGTSGVRQPDEDVDTLLSVAELAARAADAGLDVAVISGLSEADRSASLDRYQGQDRTRLERLLGRLEGRPLRARRNYLLHARCVATVRSWAKDQKPRETSLRFIEQSTGFGCLARSFAGIYLLVLHFDEPFSELHAEGAALHALPVIERYVLSLPPIDPLPPQGRVFRMPVPKK